MTSEREQLANDFVDWLRSTGCATAPYGIIEGKTADPNGRTARSVTFGIARRLDANIKIYGPRFIVLYDSGHGRVKCSSIDEVKLILRERWGFGS